MLTELVKERKKEQVAKKKEVREVPFEGAKTVRELEAVRDQIKALQEIEEALKASVGKHLGEVGVKAQEWQDEDGSRWQAELRESDRRTVDEPALIGYLQEYKPEVWDAVKKVSWTINEDAFKQALTENKVSTTEIPMKGPITKAIYVKKIG